MCCTEPRRGSSSNSNPKLLQSCSKATAPGGRSCYHLNPHAPFSTTKRTILLGLRLPPLGGITGPNIGPSPAPLTGPAFHGSPKPPPAPRSSNPQRPTPPAASQPARFLHWLTSSHSKRPQPSSTFSTPTPVTRTHPRTLRPFRSFRCRAMHPRLASLTALPQNASRSSLSMGRPRATTSVAVSDSAQQNERSRWVRFFAALTRATTALSER